MIPTIILIDDKIELDCGEHALDRLRAKSIPNRRYSKTRKVWRAPATLNVFNYLNKAWPLAKWSDEAAEAWIALQKEAAQRLVTVYTDKFDEGVLKGLWPWPTKPYAHQRQALAASIPHNAFAYLMDQGTGKTWTSIAWLMAKMQREGCEGAIVIVPNSIKHQWVDQIRLHAYNGVDHNISTWYSQPTAKQRRNEEDWADLFTTDKFRTRHFHWFIVNCEALAMARCEAFLLKMLKHRKLAIVVDESTRFKNRNASRTKGLMRLRRHAPFRLIMSGTPIIKSPMDAFAQFGFLDPAILGFDNFFSFRNHYGIMGGYQGKQVVSFKNMEPLGDSIKSSSFRVTKDECLDLPPKVGGVTDPAGYRFRKVAMGKVQRTEYNRMREELIALLDDVCKVCDGAGFVARSIVDNDHWGDRHTMLRGKKRREAEEAAQSVCPECLGEAKAVLVKIRLTQLLRMQQITSGFITDGPEILHWFDDGCPPKIAEAISIIEDAPTQQGITWSIFRPEIERMAQELARRKISYIEIHGGIADGLRPDYLRAFMNGDVQHALMHPAAGGIGLDMYAAQYATYISNSAKTEDRVQSEDRCHRIGSEIHESVDYHDVAVPGTYDMKVLRDLRRDTERSGDILGDTVTKIKELIT